MPLIHIIKKEFLQVFRDKAMVRIIFVVPLVQLLVLAYAVSMDLKDVRVVVLDQDNSASSREIISAVFASDLFKDSGKVGSREELRDSMLKDRADIAIWIAKGFEQAIYSGESGETALIVDGVNSQLAGQAAGAAQALLLREAMKIQQRIAAGNPSARRNLHLISPELRYFYNPELKSRFYMVPAIVVLLVTIISAMLTGMAIVREKEIGSLEQLMVSPISPAQLIAGKTIPFAILAFFEMILATVFAVLWFKLPFAGSVFLLAGSFLIYLIVTLGVGLLASTISQTQQQAMLTIWFFLVFGILMSGFFYPIANMPDWAQVLSYLNPMRYIVFIVRGIFLRGATFTDILPHLLPLAGLGVVIFTTAVLKFNKRVG